MNTDYSYMDVTDEAEATAVEQVLEQLRVEQPNTDMETLLNTAIERAGYDVGMTSLELCVSCGALYNSDYGGEYIDPFGDAELAEELSISEQTLSRLQYNHYCDFQCLRTAVYALDEVPA